MSSKKLDFLLKYIFKTIFFKIVFLQQFKFVLKINCIEE